MNHSNKKKQCILKSEVTYGENILSQKSKIFLFRLRVLSLRRYENRKNVSQKLQTFPFRLRVGYLNFDQILRETSNYQSYQTFPTTDNDRSYYVLALHWPKTTCEIINENEKEDCECELGDPRLTDFKSWKIHGYWPVDVKGILKFLRKYILL